MEKYILDRFEENLIVLVAKTGKIVNIEKSLLPDACEGDVVVFENGEYRIEKEETTKRNRRIEEKLKRLLGKG